MVYICSPYRGDIEKNIDFAKCCCKTACELNHIPIAPHLYFTQFLDDTIDAQRNQGIQYGLMLLDLCDEVWVFGSTISDGMKMEIEYAKSHNKGVIYIGS